MSSYIAPARPVTPRVPYSLGDMLINLLKHLISVPLSGLANRKEGPRIAYVPETISAKTVKEATKAYERKSLHLVIAVSGDKKESRETWVLRGREEGERQN